MRKGRTRNKEEERLAAAILRHARSIFFFSECSRASSYDRFNFWRKESTLDRLLERLHLRLNEESHLAFPLWSIGATSIRAIRAAAGAHRGNLVVNGHGIPLATTITAGQTKQNPFLGPMPAC